MQRKRTTSIGPYSRPGVLAKLDGRTREARLVRETRTAFMAHFGGKPSATQAALIERAVQLSLRVAMMDERFAETGQQTEHDTRTYLAWSAGLARVLRQLGMKGTTQREPTLAEIMAAPRQPATVPGP